METLERQLMGTLDTVIVGTQYQDGGVEPGDRVLLQREPDNDFDRNAVLCISPNREAVGYLPRRVAKWIAPVMDARVADFSAVAKGVHETRPELYRLAINFEFGERVEIDRPRDWRYAIHTIVNDAFNRIDILASPSDIDSLAKRLWKLDNRDLLPETYMLLHLLPSRAQHMKRKQRTLALERCKKSIEALHVGTRQGHGNIQFFPILGEANDTPQYRLLSDAIDSGDAEVTEISDSGEVGQLKLVNHGVLPILLPEGEMLIGAKQNRVVNITMLAAANSETLIPVSCVEEGRWRHDSHAFNTSAFAPPELRRRKSASVNQNRMQSGTAESNQSAVWDDVAHCLNEAAADSDTSSITAAYEKRRARIDACRAAIQLPENAIGFVASIDGVVKGIELFDAPSTLSALWPRLSDGYILEAVARDDASTANTSEDTVRSFLEQLTNEFDIAEDTPGLGHALTFPTETLTGAGLTTDTHLLHLAAFAGQPLEEQRVY